MAPLHDEIVETPNEEVTVATALGRGVSTLIPPEGLATLMRERSIRLYLGFDPTRPKLHLGNAVVLRKLQHFVELGHYVILLFGTFTGKIGDPTDKSATRVQLSDMEIQSNIATYEEQAGIVLDISKVQIVYNHEWLASLNFADVIDLAAEFKLREVLARKDFADRLADPSKTIRMHELLYMLMQAYDAVALDVDLEVGGKDQIPNMMAGRDLVNSQRNHEKWVLGMNLLVGPNGEKLGKTTGGAINITDPGEVIFEGLMRLPDDTTPLVLELLTGVPMELVTRVSEALEQQTGKPLLMKEAAAWRVIAELFGGDAATNARDIYHLVKREGVIPPNLKGETFDDVLSLSDLLLRLGIEASEFDAKERIKKGVMIDGQKVTKNINLRLGTYVFQPTKNDIGGARRIIIE